MLHYFIVLRNKEQTEIDLSEHTRSSGQPRGISPYRPSNHSYGIPGPNCRQPDEEQRNVSLRGWLAEGNQSERRGNYSKISQANREGPRLGAEIAQLISSILNRLSILLRYSRI